MAWLTCSLHRSCKSGRHLSTGPREVCSVVLPRAAGEATGVRTEPGTPHGRTFPEHSSLYLPATTRVWAEYYHHARCSNQDTMHVKCCQCGASKDSSCFTRTQLAKPSSGRRCRDCVGLQEQAGHAPAHGQGQAQGRGHGSRGSRGGAANSARGGGRVRVRDVQRVYGHMCEIPLQAYDEAGVACSWDDWVSEEDVEAASRAWDARSIAHDIDTQWGAMPWGGAYKDSNRYWGPGDYDFY